jgi:hypothetical protein
MSDSGPIQWVAAAAVIAALDGDLTVGARRVIGRSALIGERKTSSIARATNAPIILLVTDDVSELHCKFGCLRRPIRAAAGRAPARCPSVPLQAD